MNFGFYIILIAQFLSALADNALLFAAIALLVELNAPSWHTPVLQEFFVFSYIVLAPFVGAFSDALPKGRVMFISNNIKLLGCIGMLLGLNPLFAYGIVGLGAAAYSPAKYGILTEYLAADQLVVANAWMEGATVLAIILGAIIGGVMLNPTLLQTISLELPMLAGFDVAKFAIVLIIGLYISAAACNLLIPKTAPDHKPTKRDPISLVRDFWQSFLQLWRDPLGEVSLAVTTLFWGAGATLRLVILTWAVLVLKFDIQQATQLTATVAIGIAIGAVIAGRYVSLNQAIKVIPAGIIMGLVVISMIFVTSPIIAAILLGVIGMLGGFFVVPMNALLQHRGHLLMGAGHSIAVQNFNENLSILLMLGLYAILDHANWSINAITIVFGVFISLSMLIIQIHYRHIDPEQHG
ncbi:lysophospholipid transporter LplT [Sulfuriferula nivalis]|uniref:Lysophospholipid transporter LplT n=1 Tax=Sulfuriferula nivalis TaxID=2675298 RepID=A0A809RHZ1_9PROT|nr:lysophospholipid transporter LplT [Sulfuriferula nivalis]BBP00464.1 lysophospholipid transporter LplT [Sulfuriferula nivalis]